MLCFIVKYIIARKDNCTTAKNGKNIHTWCNCCYHGNSISETETDRGKYERELPERWKDEDKILVCVLATSEMRLSNKESVWFIFVTEGTVFKIVHKQRWYYNNSCVVCYGIW